MRLFVFVFGVLLYVGLGTIIYTLMRKYIGACRSGNESNAVEDAEETFHGVLFLVAWPLAAPVTFIIAMIKSVNRSTRRKPTPLTEEQKLLEREIRKAHKELKEGRYSKYEDD